MLTLAEHESVLLQSVMEAVREVLHIPLTLDSPHSFEESAIQTDMSVLIGFIGDMEGRLLIGGQAQTLGKIGESLYGMSLEGEMLQSFVGELANMMAGTMCTFIFKKGMRFDITPPTMMAGTLNLLGFKSGIKIPLALHDIGEMNIILLL